MTWTLDSIGLVAACFVLGSIPFSYLVVRLRTGSDLRRVGSGNPGATNALRTAGPAAGVVGLVLDAAKGFVPVWLAKGAGFPGHVIGAVAVACVVGHVFSPFLRFRGGKGVATGFGALTALNPVTGALGLLVFVALVATSRVVSLASVLAVASFPLLWTLPERFGDVAPAGRSGWWAAIVIFLLVLMRHLPNLRRLVAGTESRLGEKRA